MRQMFSRLCVVLNVNSQLWNTAAKYSTKASRLPVLTLYTKDPCPLCDVAKAKISGLQERFQFETVDITSSGNEEWWSKYKFEIPVFHFEGQFLMKHRADVELLETAIKNFEKNNC